ncbi:hypothetical protein PCASD_05540 [Puccinia coronata f. sp. avenae]|uniref:Uncharacterized protein n=1 Tax=Puccinia coronata f. sp. avenae TaxID=200324 RepID=A0A2N5UW10_9BASI|nr:hypothetical protein PCASD_05540 [Puccinia coronata f. sp. avenae]
MPHAMCTPTIGMHMASRRARQACRAYTPVGSRKPLDLRGLREPRYPYKGTRSTLIRVPKYPYKGTGTLIAGLTSASRFERLTLSNREAYVSQPRSVPLELTWARVPKPATNHTNPSPRTAPPLNGPTTAL